MGEESKELSHHINGYRDDNNQSKYKPSYRTLDNALHGAFECVVDIHNTDYSTGEG